MAEGRPDRGERPWTRTRGRLGPKVALKEQLAADRSENAAAVGGSKYLMRGRRPAGGGGRIAADSAGRPRRQQKLLHIIWIYRYKFLDILYIIFPGRGHRHSPPADSGRVRVSGGGGGAAGSCVAALLSESAAGRTHTTGPPEPPSGPRARVRRRGRAPSPPPLPPSARTPQRGRWVAFFPACEPGRERPGSAARACDSGWEVPPASPRRDSGGGGRLGGSARPRPIGIIDGHGRSARRQRRLRQARRARARAVPPLGVPARKGSLGGAGVAPGARAGGVGLPARLRACSGGGSASPGRFRRHRRRRRPRARPAAAFAAVECGRTVMLDRSGPISNRSYLLIIRFYLRAGRGSDIRPPALEPARTDQPLAVTGSPKRRRGAGAVAARAPRAAAGLSDHLRFGRRSGRLGLVTSSPGRPWPPASAALTHPRGPDARLQRRP